MKIHFWIYVIIVHTRICVFFLTTDIHIVQMKTNSQWIHFKDIQNTNTWKITRIWYCFTYIFFIQLFSLQTFKYKYFFLISFISQVAKRIHCKDTSPSPDLVFTQSIICVFIRNTLKENVFAFVWKLSFVCIWVIHDWVLNWIYEEAMPNFHDMELFCLYVTFSISW